MKILRQRVGTDLGGEASPLGGSVAPHGLQLLLSRSDPRLSVFALLVEVVRQRPQLRPPGGLQDAPPLLLRLPDQPLELRLPALRQAFPPRPQAEQLGVPLGFGGDDGLKGEERETVA